MKLSTINPIINDKWFDFISSHFHSTIFHHPQWLLILKEQYKFNVFAVVSINEKNEIEAGIPFCEVKSITGKIDWISLPFSDYCQPLYYEEKNISAIEEFLIKKKEEEKINSIEIRGEISGSIFLKKDGFYLHTTKLRTNQEELFSSFKKTQIQQPIKKAERNGVSYVISTSFKQVEEFYYLHLKTRKKLGVPIQPKNFFKEIYDKLIEPGLGFLVITYKDSLPIGAGLFLGFKNILTYKYSASDPDKLKLRPNHLMLWVAIQEGIKRGFNYFDFGRTEIDNEGLRKFKSGWGSNEKPLFYSFYPKLPKDSKLKIINEKFVSPLIKNSPEFVCKTIGELVYKYFPSI